MHLSLFASAEKLRNQKRSPNLISHCEVEDKRRFWCSFGAKADEAICNYEEGRIRNLWINYSTIKHCVGGIAYLDINLLRNNGFGVPYTFRHILSLFEKFEREGWVTKIKGGSMYALASQKKIIRRYYSKIPRRQLNGKNFLSADKNSKLVAIVCYLISDRSIKSQIYAECVKESGHKKATVIKQTALLPCPHYTLSTRGTSKKMGYKSPTTGTNLQRRFRDMGLANVFRREKPIGELDEYKWLLKTEPDVLARVHRKKDGVYYVRLTNNIVPIVGFRRYKSKNRDYNMSFDEYRKQNLSKKVA